MSKHFVEEDGGGPSRKQCRPVIGFGQRSRFQRVQVFSNFLYACLDLCL